MKKMLNLAVLTILSAQLYAGGTSMDNIVKHYLEVQQALVQSDAAAAQHAGNLLKAALHVTDDFTTSERQVYNEQFDALMKNAHQIADTRDLNKQRDALADLTPALWELISVADSLTVKLYLQYCPMRKANWISASEKVENPYYGGSMLTCGSIKAVK